MPKRRNLQLSSFSPNVRTERKRAFLHVFPFRMRPLPAFLPFKKPLRNVFVFPGLMDDLRHSKLGAIFAGRRRHMLSRLVR